MSAIDKLLKIADRFERTVKRAATDAERQEMEKFRKDVKEMSEDVLSDDEIRELQDLLNQFLFSKNRKLYLEIDGRFGPNTLEAMRVARKKLNNPNLKDRQLLSSLRAKFPSAIA